MMIVFRVLTLSRYSRGRIGYSGKIFAPETNSLALSQSQIHIRVVEVLILKNNICLGKDFLTLVSAEEAAGGDPVAPSSLRPDTEPEGDRLCEAAAAGGRGAPACSESADCCLDDDMATTVKHSNYTI